MLVEIKLLIHKVTSATKKENKMKPVDMGGLCRIC